ncbi:MAG TPA: GNAT family N-acetyltransferase [Bdellovibrio sp.]|nr:GNAT family N-acetyltransferase [Bdellovibrio sp.]
MDTKIFVTTFKEYKVEAEKFYQACNRKAQIELDDTLIVALENEKLAGIVRLCFEQGVFVLRTMQIHPDFQRKGIGSLIFKKFDEVLKEREIKKIFCMPYEHLEGFYGQIGFLKIPASEAPSFLQQRLADFRPKAAAEKAILMKRILK